MKKLILSPGNRLTLIFQTSDSTSEQQRHVGFSGAYEAVGFCSKCVFDIPEGRVLSPGYPHPTPPSVSCNYIISVKPGFTVTLNFTDKFHIYSVDTEQGPSCSHHWLKVIVPGREPTKLCGAKRPGVISTDSNIVRLEYHTDEHGLSNGWSLDYSTRKVQCSQPGDVVNGRVNPILTEYFHGDRAHVTCDPGYRLMTNCQNLNTFSAQCQINGQWDRPMPECQSTLIDCGEPEPLLNGGVTLLSGFQNQHCSVIQYHCNEPFYSLSGGGNVTFTCEANGKWKSSHKSDVTPTCIPVCGQPTERIYIFERIIGGSNAPKNTIPWQVMLSIDGGRGGGMVIADRWILTAASILSNQGVEAPVNTIRIFMGGNNARTDLVPHVNVSSIHLHPQYNNPHNLNYDNDIALIKLQDPITFHARVMPICLPADGAAYNDGVMGLVSGFGLDIISDRSILTNKLKYVPVPLVNQETCIASITLKKEEMGENRVPNLTNNMFCAGFPEGGKDSCTGDSGGPLALIENGHFWAAGVVSWGVDCGKPGTYGVYTKVVNYLDWINKTMREN
ncbi:complement C1r subcomponent-like [Betta splendens]|uniref:Complement C1r subcomponent-like n=1 Tax=Betta splendens TaxID=158456 RepID=A0A6P7KRQ4_BETSP|nr:complement C1r subcomponent-like [Betta splendens]